MDKPYYHISEQSLGEGAKIPLCKMRNSEEVFRAMADKMADCILRNNAAARSLSARWGRWASTPSLWSGSTGSASA